MRTFANLVDILQRLALVATLQVSFSSQQQYFGITHHAQVNVLQNLEVRGVIDTVLLEGTVFPVEVTLVAHQLSPGIERQAVSLHLLIGTNRAIQAVTILTLSSHESIVEALAGIEETVGTGGNLSRSLSREGHAVGTPALHDKGHSHLIPSLLSVVTFLDFEYRLAAAVSGYMPQLVVVALPEVILLRANHLVQFGSCLAVLLLEEVSLTQHGLSGLLGDAHARFAVVHSFL